MNFQSYFLLLPCIAGFFWLLAYLLFASKGVVFSKLKRFLLVFSLFCLFSFLSLDESSRLLLHFTLFKQFFALLLVPTFIIYVKARQGVRPKGVIFTILSVVPYIQLIVGIETVYSAGFENALRVLIDSFTFQGPMFPYLPQKDQQVFYACYTYIFRTFLLADFLMFSVTLMTCVINGNCSIRDVMGFYFRGMKAPLRPVQYFQSLVLFLILVPALILGKRVYIDSVAVTFIASFVIAVLISLIAFVGTTGRTERQSIPGILNTVRFGGKYTDDQESSDDTDKPDDKKTAEPVAPEPLKTVHVQSNPEDMERLREQLESKLEQVVVADKLFLNRDITLISVSDRLGVFKDELSDFIDYKYGVSFQNYINMLRIRYAEQYILQHDDVTQKEIALACGFSGASSFNSAFSKQNGVTPKIWKDRHLESSRNA